MPRIAARLVSGDLDSATPAWRRHGGLSTEYPVWAEAGIVAPPPKAVVFAEEEVAAANEPDPAEAEPVASRQTGDPEQEETPKRPAGS